MFNASPHEEHFFLPNGKISSCNLSLLRSYPFAVNTREESGSLLLFFQMQDTIPVLLTLPLRRLNKPCRLSTSMYLLDAFCQTPLPLLWFVSILFHRTQN